MNVVALQHSASYMQQQAQHSEYYCIYCKNDDIVVDSTFGDAICRGCGLVVCERMASLEAEWQNYDDNGDASHAHARASKVGDGDDGTIFFAGTLGTKQERELLQDIQNQFSSKGQRIADNLSDISELTFKLGLGAQIKDHAKALYETAHLQGLARHGGSYGGGKVLIATAIHLACRQTGYPRTLKEIALVSGVPVKQIGRMVTRLTAAEDEDDNSKTAAGGGGGDSNKRNGDECGQDAGSNVGEVKSGAVNNDAQTGLERRKGDSNGSREEDCRAKRLKIDSSNKQPVDNTHTDGNTHTTRSSSKTSVSRILPVDLVPRIATHISLSSKFIDVARHACERIHALTLLPSSMTPHCVAATVVLCVSFVSSKHMDIANIATVAPCSVQHITKAYTQLRPFIKSIFPKEFVLAEEAGINSLPFSLKELTDA